MTQSGIKALYYPFSRTQDISSIKQFLLLYDQTTFLDPVSDEAWRAHLFSNLKGVHDGFGKYAELAASFPMLISEGVVKIIDPKKVAAKDSNLTTAGILSDLADENWLRLCNPTQSGIPHETDHESGKPLWQMFKSKIPDQLLETPLDGEFLSQHFLAPGGERYAWHLSYAAGSAIALNVHMAAAEELGLQLVSDSALHNRLLLAKAMRGSNSGSSELLDHGQAEHIANTAMIKVLDRLMPTEVLESIAVEDILRFRQDTEGLRAEFSAEIRSLVKGHDGLHESRQTFIPDDLAHRLANDVRNYGNELAAVRDNIWPRLLDSVTSAVPVATSGAGYAASYISGSGYALAASVLLHALSPLKAMLEIKADLKKVRRSPSSAVAFLVKSQQLTKG